MAKPTKIDLNTLGGDSFVANKANIPLATKLQLTGVKPATVSMFGTYGNDINTYPNDTVRLDIQNAANLYLESNYRVKTTTKSGVEVTAYPEKDLADLGYLAGKYNVVYKFHRNLLGAGDSHKLLIEEISADRLELRVVPMVAINQPNEDFISFFTSGFFAIPKSQTLVNLYLFSDANTALSIYDYVQDAFTFNAPPYSIIFKLNSPAPSSINVGSQLWLSQQVSDDLSDVITIVPPKSKKTNTRIAGPNWNVLAKQQTAISTQYKDWDDILSTNTQTSNNLVNSVLSSSLLEGIPLNVDYRSFDNYITFGSAAERLYNFEYKMKLLEAYDSQISLISGSSVGATADNSSSYYYNKNITDVLAKKNALLGSFDGYEKYLYYESSSYVSSSYGEYYPTTWPKSNSTKPYTNLSSTSSYVQNWFAGIISSASLYDQNNNKALYKLIPNHIQEDSSNDQYVLFTNMIGHYFDLLYAYIKQINYTYNRDESYLEGFSKELIYHVSQNLGLDFENGSSLDDLWSYVLGTDATGSLNSTYQLNTQDKAKQIWKRIINNLPYLLKTKGTERGVRALINCFGIPSTILRIKEYGGPEPDFESASDFAFDRFNYGTVVGYNGSAAYTSNPAFTCQRIQLPWHTSSYAPTYPVTIELRAKMAPKQTKTQKLLERTGSWYIQAYRENNNQYLGFFLGNNAGNASTHSTRSISTSYTSASVSCSIYDGDWHYIALRRENPTDVDSVNQTYTLVVKKTNYQKVTTTYTASLLITGSGAGSASNQAFTNAAPPGTGSVPQAGGLWLPIAPTDGNTGSIALNQSHSMLAWSGSVQEVRYWSVPLSDSTMNKHALNPTSFVGNSDGVYSGTTSSFDTLWFRLPLGADNNKLPITASGTYAVSSSHPNQQRFVSASLFYGFTGSFYTPVVDTYVTEWPDLSGNRSVSNKIRIDNTIRTTNQLRKDISIERSLLDSYPPDNAKLGIFLSPTDEVNMDIAEQFGGISIDDYIGDPSKLSDENYADLEGLQYQYFKKYSGIRYRPQNYIRLLKYYDTALFKLIDKFVPERASTSIGLVVEPHLLQRSKIPTKQPSWENLYYTSSINIDNTVNTSGFIEDGDKEFGRTSNNYVQQGILEGAGNYTLDISGEELQTDPITVIEAGTKVSATFTNSTVNEFNNGGVSNNPSSNDSLIGDVDLGVTGYGRDARVDGSQYVFLSSYITAPQPSGSNIMVDNSTNLSTDLNNPPWNYNGSGDTLTPNYSSDTAPDGTTTATYHSSSFNNGLWKSLNNTIYANTRYTLECYYKYLTGTTGSVFFRFGLENLVRYDFGHETFSNVNEAVTDKAGSIVDVGINGWKLARIDFMVTASIPSYTVTLYQQKTSTPATQSMLLWRPALYTSAVRSYLQPITSSRYDYSEVLNPTILTNNYSNTCNISNNIYDTDVFAGRAFRDFTAYATNATVTTNTIFTSSTAIEQNKWTSVYGLRIIDAYTGSTAYPSVFNTSSYWSLTSSLGLVYNRTGSFVTTSSIKLPTFFYNPTAINSWDYLYQVKISGTGSSSPTTVTLFYGDLDCNLSQSFSATSNWSQTYTTKAVGNWLGIRLNTTNANSQSFAINNLSVTCLNYRAQVQDFHLQDSYGMRNARYDGSKLTSADWNINSSDTTDGGPVVTVTVGGGKQLSVNPDVTGVFKIK